MRGSSIVLFASIFSLGRMGEKTTTSTANRENEGGLARRRGEGSGGRVLFLLNERTGLPNRSVERGGSNWSRPRET